MIPEASGRPRILLRFDRDPERSKQHSYRLSGVELRSSRELAELLPFAVPPSGAEPKLLDMPPWIREPGGLPLVYQGRGWIGGREVAVTARASDDRHRVELEDGTVISVFERSGDLVVWVTRGRDPEAGRFGALGPGLALALALARCFSLHAGAVSVAGRAVAFLGESGSGKSTMARLASGRRGCRRIADDVLPVWTSRDGRLRLAPRFPQLKLDRAEQWQGGEEVACRDLVAIRRQPGLDAAELSERSKREGVLALLESTVASRLFSKQLRRRELDTWVTVAGANRVLEWRVPDDPGRITESFESLESFLSDDS